MGADVCPVVAGAVVELHVGVAAAVVGGELEAHGGWCWVGLVVVVVVVFVVWLWVCESGGC